MSGNTATGTTNKGAGEGIARTNTQEIMQMFQNPAQIANMRAMLSGDDSGPKPLPLLCCLSLFCCIAIGLVGFSLFLAVFSIYVLAEEGDDVKKMNKFMGEDCKGGDAYDYMLVYCISTWITLVGVPCLTRMLIPKDDDGKDNQEAESKWTQPLSCLSCILALMGFVANCAMVHFVTNMSDICETAYDKAAGNFYLCMEMICWSFVGMLCVMGLVCVCTCCGLCFGASMDDSTTTANQPCGGQRV